MTEFGHGLRQRLATRTSPPTASAQRLPRRMPAFLRTLGHSLLTNTWPTRGWEDWA